MVLESGDATTATVEVQPAGKSATPGTGGYFEIVDIPPGSYTIRVAAAGHSTWIQAGVHFEAGQRVDIDEIFVLAARGNLEGQVVLMLAPESEAGSHGGALVNLGSDLTMISFAPQCGQICALSSIVWVTSDTLVLPSRYLATANRFFPLGAKNP